MKPIHQWPRHKDKQMLPPYKDYIDYIRRIAQQQKDDGHTILANQRCLNALFESHIKVLELLYKQEQKETKQTEEVVNAVLNYDLSQLNGGVGALHSVTGTKESKMDLVELLNETLKNETVDPVQKIKDEHRARQHKESEEKRKKLVEDMQRHIPEELWPIVAKNLSFESDYECCISIPNHYPIYYSHNHNGFLREYYRQNGRHYYSQSFTATLIASEKPKEEKKENYTIEPKTNGPVTKEDKRARSIQLSVATVVIFTGLCPWTWFIGKIIAEKFIPL